MYEKIGGVEKNNILFDFIALARFVEMKAKKSRINDPLMKVGFNPTSLIERERRGKS